MNSVRSVTALPLTPACPTAGPSAQTAVAPRHAARDAPPAPGRHGATTRARAEVFVAEDDAHMRALLELAVRRAGHDAIACGSGLELLERLRHARAAGRPPALVVSDNRMPGRAGIEVVEIVRGWGLEIPFALVTGFLDDALRSQATRLRVGALLRKPASLGDLTFMISQLAGRGPGPATAVARCAMCGDPMTAGTCGECAPTDRLVLRFDPDDPYAEVGGSD